MTKRSCKNGAESNYCPNQFKNKRKRIYCSSEKENFMDFLNFNTKTTDNNVSEYLYADSFFINQTQNDYYNRLEAGGVGATEKEIFYDCFPCDNESGMQNIMQPQLQIFEVINEIKNPKEFKSLLKQMASTSNALYRTFRQAYNKSKKRKCFSEKCNRISEKPDDKFARGDMKPLEIVNIEVPSYKKEYVEDIRYESWSKNKHKKKKSNKKEKCIEEQECFCYICSNCQKSNNDDEEKVCNICKGPLENDEALNCEEKASQKSLETKKFEDFPEAKENASECNFQREYKWFPQDYCAKETNVCDKFENELQDLNFCDKCAVLRGEMPWPNKMEDETLCDYKPDITEKSPQSCHQPVKCCKMESYCKTKGGSQEYPQTTKQVLNLNPVCLTIPLKLQIDSENCQSRFIETEIVMETCGGFQNQLTTCLNKTEAMPFKSEPIPLKTLKPPKQVKTGSDMFYSCISNSGIIKPDETPRIRYDSSLTEVLDIIKKHKSQPEEISKTYQIATTKQLEEKGIQLPIRSSLPAPTVSYAKDSTGRTDFTQTEEVPIPVKTIPATVSKRTPTTQPALNIIDPKAKANKLRAELLEEVRSALEKSTPVAALKALLEGKRFSLPTDLRPKETTNITPVRHSFPSSYQTMPSITKPLQPLAPFTPAGSSKPAIPPKPTLTPKTITETVQTDASTLKASGHYKRNEMRTEIQEGLRELLEPNAAKSQPKYKPEERDEILLDLHKLFHPQKAESLPQQINREHALQDIRYIVGPEIPGTPLQTSDSRESVIQCIKHILNPKSQALKSMKKKYTKETKEKILEDLQIILKPHDKKKEFNQEIRNSVLYDLRFMLDTGEGATSPQRPPRLSQIQKPIPVEVPGPGTSRAQQVRQQRQQKPPNEIRDSLIADLRYMLDSTHPVPDPIASTSPTKPKRTHSATSSEVSVFELEKPSSRHK